MVYHNTIKILPIQCHSRSLRKNNGCFNIKKIWNVVESQLFKKLATEPIKVKGMYIYGKLRTWQEHIKTNLHGQEVPYDMYCFATAVLKIDSVYKQGKNYHPQVYVEECKYTALENHRQRNILSDDDDDGFFEV